MQNDVCREFDMRKLYSHSSAEGGTLMSAVMQMYHGFVMSLEANHLSVCF